MFVYRCLIFVPGESVQFIYENIIPLFFLAVFYHFPKRRTVVVCSGHSSVDITVKYQNVMLFGIILTYSQLSFYRLLRLVFTAVSGVNHRCFHNQFMNSF